jgi:predicted O-methyltransferase YrrM
MAASPERSNHGTMLSIGYGTGYELKMASQVLNGWHIEAYDTDSQTTTRARQLFESFGISRDIPIGG